MATTQASVLGTTPLVANQLGSDPIGDRVTGVSGIGQRRAHPRVRPYEVAWRRALINSNAIGSTDTITMPSATSEKFSFTTGTLPKA